MRKRKTESLHLRHLFLKEEERMIAIGMTRDLLGAGLFCGAVLAWAWVLQ